MTPEQRLKRVERILGRLAVRGRKTRNEFRDRINILIDAQIRSEETFREKMNILTDAQTRSEETFRKKINILTDTQTRSEETFREKINILTDTQTRSDEAWLRNEEARLRHEEAWRAESHAIDEQIKNVALAQIDLTKSQKLTDRALRDFINSLRKNRNGR